MKLKALRTKEQRKFISEQTRKALAARKSRGASPNGKKGREISNEKRRKATQKAFDMILDLHKRSYKYRYISNELNKAGLVTSTGEPWTRQKVYGRLKPLKDKIAQQIKKGL